MTEIAEQARPAPVFIMGCQRSGTTLVSQILNSHPHLAIYHESFSFHILYAELKYYGDLRVLKNLQQLAEDMSGIVALQSRELDANGTTFTPAAADILDKTRTADFAGVVTAVLELYAQAQGKHRCGDKTPENYQYLPRILDLFPDSPILFLMRDPRDTILSSQRLFGSSLEQGARMWNDAYRSYARNEASVRLIRYEELVSAPEAVLQELCRYIDEPYDEAMLSFFKHIPERFLARRRNLALVGSPISTSSIGNFRNMKPEQVQLIEAYCREGMSAMGYEFTEAPLEGVELPARRKTQRLRFYTRRLRYYGFNLERWRHGWARWKVMLRLRLRYYPARLFSHKYP